MDKHTQLPWHRHQHEDDAITGPDGKEIALVNTFGKRPEAEDDANLAYIVKAANLHERMVSALEKIMSHIDRMETLGMLAVKNDQAKGCAVFSLSVASEQARAVLEEARKA